MKVCQVCQDAVPKYKCAKCRHVEYCSVICYKKHAEACDPAPLNIEETRECKSEDSNHAPLEWSSRLTDTQKQALASCDSIKLALQNQELRKIILAIDSADDPTAAKTLLESELASNQYLVDFVSELLQVVKNPSA